MSERLEPAGGAERRERLGRARLMLVLTPAAARAGADPLAILEQALPWVDAIQVRIKPLGKDASAVASARETHDWTLRVLALVRRAASPALVLVDDRVDVARALAAQGVDGVHVGQDDLAPRDVRRLLGDELLIGLSTHDGRDLARAVDEPVDYLGFGPVWSTATKGYRLGKGPETAWVAASSAAPRPLFPIGGIDATNACDLAPVGRAAVSAAILGAADPAAAAQAIRTALEGQP